MDSKTVVSSKGQVVIPIEMRKALGLHSGSELLLHLREDSVLEIESIKRSITMFFGRGKRKKSSVSLSVEEMDQAIAEAISEHD